MHPLLADVYKVISIMYYGALKYTYNINTEYCTVELKKTLLLLFKKNITQDAIFVVSLKKI